MTNPLSAETRAEIVQMLESGVMPQVIAQEIGVGTSTVYGIRDEIGLDRRTKDPLDGIPVDEVVADYVAGKRISWICAKYKFDQAKLYQILAKMNIPTHKYSPEEHATRQRALDEAVAMYEGGLKIHEIVRESGVHQVALHQELRKRGISLRNRERKTNNAPG